MSPHCGTTTVYGPWASGFGLTPQFPQRLAAVFTDFGDAFPVLRGLTAHFGIFMAVGLAIVLLIVWSRTKWGFEVSVIGDNPCAATPAST